MAWWTRKGLRRPPRHPMARAEARANPNGNVFEIAEGWDPDGEVPPGAIMGAWKVDGRGRMTGEYEPNPNHDPDLPSPGWRPPGD